MKVPRIQILPPELVGKIAAGEVVERPASVVKELVENALDAGASRIVVELEQGGRELIRVVDDGCGIFREDLPLVFARHATSKLSREDDLNHIRSLGFRGEALAALGSVAWVRIQSRTAQESIGGQLVCDGGQLGTVAPWAGAVGTCVEVRRLFFNTPARRKFLRSVSTELAYILETVQRLALAFLGVHFRLTHEEREVLEVPGSWDRYQRVQHLFGEAIADRLLPVETATASVRVHGWIGHPEEARSSGRCQYFFVNQRYIRDRMLTHAVQEAFRGYLMVGRQPIVFLFVELPAEAVDVNVHPMKIEVRFRDQQLVYQTVLHGVREALRQLRGESAQAVRGWVSVPAAAAAPRLNDGDAVGPDVVAPGVPSASRQERPSQFTESASPAVVPVSLPCANPTGKPSATGPSVADLASRKPPTGQEQTEVRAEVASISPPSSRLSNQRSFFGTESPWRAMQLHNTYLVVEMPDGLLLVDQHALHERILYEQFREQLQAGTPARQNLLVPEPVDLTAAQAALVLEHAPALEKVALSLSEFGGSTVLVHAVPACWKRSAAELVHIVAEYLAEVARVPEPQVLLDELLKRMACRAAIKAGDPLTPEDIAFLLEHRSLVENAHHCPHGRPTALFLSKHELERQFRRLG
ncbi:MAG: DNA mismatch repair endonuclease MutL [Gemmatales bacterium]|nr:DNA mismatch repair endonuclease MutL [Gemmatales bacterium]MDW8221668.1 DNA mismatch repair endonuclease MutL [Gemmatales bacterium]